MALITSVTFKEANKDPHADSSAEPQSVDMSAQAKFGAKKLMTLDGQNL
jgi:hypothetical protein